MGGSSFSPSDAHNVREAGPRQRGKELTRPRSALRGGGGDRSADARWSLRPRCAFCCGPPNICSLRPSHPLREPG